MPRSHGEIKEREKEEREGRKEKEGGKGLSDVDQVELLGLLTRMWYETLKL